MVVYNAWILTIAPIIPLKLHSLSLVILLWLLNPKSFLYPLLIGCSFHEWLLSFKYLNISDSLEIHSIVFRSSPGSPLRFFGISTMSVCPTLPYSLISHFFPSLHVIFGESHIVSWFPLPRTEPIPFILLHQITFSSSISMYSVVKEQLKGQDRILNIWVDIFFWISVLGFFGYIPKVELLSHKAVLFLIF